MDREVTLARSALARAHQVVAGREPDPCLIAELKRDLEVAKLAAHIRQVAADAPLTAPQSQRLLGLLLFGGERA